jgi:hypothetical protein
VHKKRLTQRHSLYILQCSKTIMVKLNGKQS